MTILSTAVAPTDNARAAQYNNLRTDLLAHTHDGVDTPGITGLSPRVGINVSPLAAVGTLNVTPPLALGNVVPLHVRRSGSGSAYIAVDNVGATGILLNDGGQAANQRIWGFEISGAVWRLTTYDDAGNSTTRMSVDRSGNVVVMGNLTFGSTGQRITGDFSSGTHASRVLVQTSVAGGNTVLGLITNGAGTASAINLYASSDPANAPFSAWSAVGTGISLTSGHFGSGVTQPFSLTIDGATVLRMHVSQGLSLLDATDPGVGVVRVGGNLLVTGALIGDPAANLTIQSIASIVAMIDSDNNDTTRAFVVRSNGVATNLFTVDESGNVSTIGTATIAGALGTGAYALTLQNTTPAGFVSIHGIDSGGGHKFFLTGYNASAAGNNSFGVAAAGTVELSSPSAMYVGTYTAVPLTLGTNALARVMVDASGKVFVGATTASNDVQGVGICVNIGASGASAFVMKSPSLAHGMTSQAETTTFGTLGALSLANGATNISGWGATTTGLYLRGSHVTDVSTHGLVDTGAVIITGYLRNGANIGSIANGANILCVQTNGENAAILTRPGDLWLNATSNVNQYDDEDDAAVARALRASIRPAGDPLRQRFGALIARYKPLIAAGGLVAYNDDAPGKARGVPFINVGRIAMFSLDAIWQLGDRLARADQRIAALEARLALQGG